MRRLLLTAAALPVQALAFSVGALIAQRFGVAVSPVAVLTAALGQASAHLDMANMILGQRLAAAVGAVEVQPGEPPTARPN